MTPPRRRKEAAKVSINFRPMNLVSSAGAKQPKKAPAKSSATMLEDTSADLCGLVAYLKSLEKLEPRLLSRPLCSPCPGHSYLANDTMEPATPVSNPKSIDPVLAIDATTRAPLCFRNRAQVEAMVLEVCERKMMARAERKENRKIWREGQEMGGGTRNDGLHVPFRGEPLVPCFSHSWRCSSRRTRI